MKVLKRIKSQRPIIRVYLYQILTIRLMKNPYVKRLNKDVDSVRKTLVKKKAILMNRYISQFRSSVSLKRVSMTTMMNLSQFPIAA